MLTVRYRISADDLNTLGRTDVIYVTFSHSSIRTSRRSMQPSIKDYRWLFKSVLRIRSFCFTGSGSMYPNLLFLCHDSQIGKLAILDSKRPKRMANETQIRIRIHTKRFYILEESDEKIRAFNLFFCIFRMIFFSLYQYSRSVTF